MLLFALTPLLHAAPQTIRLEVGTIVTEPMLTVRLEAVWLGEERSVTLTDDGSVAGDVAGDGIWLGELSGEPVSMLPLTIVVERDRGPEKEIIEAWAGNESIALDTDRLTWALELGDSPRAYRVAGATTARVASAREAAAVTAPIAWACFLLIYVAWLVERALRKPAE